MDQGLHHKGSEYLTVVRGRLAWAAERRVVDGETSHNPTLPDLEFASRLACARCPQFEVFRSLAMPKERPSRTHAAGPAERDDGDPNRLTDSSRCKGPDPDQGVPQLFGEPSISSSSKSKLTWSSWSQDVARVRL